jgi:hypothetical protein
MDMRQLVLAEEDLAGLLAVEQPGFAPRCACAPRFQCRVQRARRGHHLPHVQRVGRGDHQHARLSDVRLDQHLGLHRIA